MFDYASSHNFISATDKHTAHCCPSVLHLSTECMHEHLLDILDRKQRFAALLERCLSFLEPYVVDLVNGVMASYGVRE